MDIVLDKHAARQIRLSTAGAVEDGDTETLREDIMDAFNEEQIEEIERRIDSGDFYDFLGEILDEWSGDDVDELFEIIESQLSDFGIEIKYSDRDLDEEDEDEIIEELDDEQDDFDIDEDEDEETY